MNAIPTPELKHDLLDTTSLSDESKKEFSAWLGGYGIYHTTQFVLRLCPTVHDLVDSATKKNGRGITWEEIQAFSTYVHETVHWWQHIGSTIGFIISMGNPALVHSNLDHLRNLAKIKGVAKPILLWAEDMQQAGFDHKDEGVKNANVAINNTLDLEFYKHTIVCPQNIKTICKDKYFECIGHSFRIAYDSPLSILKESIDPNSEFLQDPDKWFDTFKDLKQKKVNGHYYGSEIYLPIIQGVDLLEGQARFIQLQFLSFGASKHITFDAVSKDGYLENEYGNAFRFFLKRTETNQPEKIDSPIVALFLLICDISLNPDEGFPKPIRDYERFINNNNCNYRFMKLCEAVKRRPELKGYIKNYSKEEYLTVAQLLSHECELNHPHSIPETVMEWKRNHKAIQELLREQISSDYKQENIIVRVLFSQFLAFNIDKYEAPELFCWTGAALANKDMREKYEPIWLRNLSLFTDKADQKTIVPRLFPFKKEENIKKTFNEFYAATMFNEIARQWIMNKGPFSYDFSWLTEEHTEEVVAAKVKEIFKSMLGIDPDEIPVHGST
ncbi:hypothetical protein IB239_09080 [Pseudomonas sp. PDM12]|uniref:hypothetical protein n=1 Tax=Pseudomonas sp. PDM12 TaxID=2769260 RepID=UPI00177C776E|nr:hypothetical protein [Pseudomonas sp. PDM12]MBD9654960.1 hypothetical protein [Pseudomonas sp. PDM12]